MKLTPTKDRVVIKPTESVEKTQGGIYIPDSAKEKPKEGEVVAVGKLEEGYNLKVGDKVIYESFGGTEVTVEGKKYLIMKSKDILAKY